MRRTNSDTTTEIRQGVKLAPQQIILSNLIQASGEDLQRIINEELQKNVMLESDESRSVEEMTGEEPVSDEREALETDGEEELDVREDSDEVKDLQDTFIDDDDLPLPNQKSRDEKEFSPITNYGTDTSFRESLKTQLSELDLGERELFQANYLVDSLEDDGYLRRSVSELVNELAWRQNFDTTIDELTRILLEVVQANLEPVGVGARDLRECLLLQLDELQQSETTMIAYKVLDESFDDFMNRRFERIMFRYDLTNKELADIQKIVHRLNPKPGGNTSSTDAMIMKASQVRPDFIVTNEDGVLVVSLTNSRIPAVRISPDYNEMLQAIGRENDSNADVKKGKAFLEQGIRSANIFISALVQRRHTLLNAMRTMVKFQSAYFLSGNIEDLKPMTLKEIADISKYDISTVSRVCSGRYVQTDFGIISLKSLYSHAVGEGKAAVSNAVIKSVLRDIVESEDKSVPYNDDELQRRLTQLGYHIARRTVVKYRTALGIPKAELRKK